MIDTIGNQMHIEMTQNIDDIKRCFENLKKLEQLGIGTQITEFDMCLPERYMFGENGKIRSEQELVELINSKMSKSSITIGSIAEFKKMKMDEISKAVEETGMQLEGITYWSINDTLDHNLERTNRKTYENGLKRDIAQTRYAGLYSDSVKSKTVSTQRLGQETLEEQKNTFLLDEIEKGQVRYIAMQKDTQKSGQNR